MLHYHQIEGTSEWRKESEELDKSVEALIQDAIRGRITLDQFIEQSDYCASAARVLVRHKLLSQVAANNYLMIYQSVIQDLKEGIKRYDSD